MPPLRDTLSRRSKTSCNRSYSPLLCRSRKSVSLSWRDGPLSANSIFTPTPPMQKQYGFLTVCKNREMRSFRESALSKVIPLTSGRDSAATAPMSTLLICSSSCVVNFTVNLLRRLIERLPLFGGETQQASTTGMLACCLTPPWDTLVCTPSSGQRNNLHLRMKILPAHHMVLGTMQPADGHGLP